MIATRNIAVGWWVIPVGLALFFALVAARDSRGATAGVRLLIWALYSVVPFLAAGVYLLAALLLGIR